MDVALANAIGIYWRVGCQQLKVPDDEGVDAYLFAVDGEVAGLGEECERVEWEGSGCEVVGEESGADEVGEVGELCVGLELLLDVDGGQLEGGVG